MPTSSAGPLHPWPYPTEAVPASLERRLPPLLSVIAGMVDLISFLSLGNIFTAHITGNLVLLAAVLVRRDPVHPAQVLAIPIFMLAVAVVWLIARLSRRRGAALARLLLSVQFLLLAALLTFSVIARPAADPHGMMAGIAAMIAVSAMACQFALLRLAVPGAPSTAVMTGNLTNAMLSLMAALAPGEPAREIADERLKATLPLLIGFLGGCCIAALAVAWLGDWAWSCPVILAGIAIVRR